MIRSDSAPAVKPGEEESRKVEHEAPCAYRDLIELYIARNLSIQELEDFELHLFKCTSCLKAIEFELTVQRMTSDFAKSAEISRSWH